ncbi:hypothetical protein C8R46DRAFT_1105893 [Mycena filopes]|nr:hypothetical protein C8R46DRAFT_1105893 [Mycena filopes]
MTMLFQSRLISVCVRAGRTRLPSHNYATKVKPPAAGSYGKLSETEKAWVKKEMNELIQLKQDLNKLGKAMKREEKKLKKFDRDSLALEKEITAFREEVNLLNLGFQVMTTPIVKKAALGQLVWLRALQVAISAATPASTATTTAPADTVALDRLLRALDAFTGNMKPLAAPLSDQFVQTHGQWDKLLGLLHSPTAPSNRELVAHAAVTLQQGMPAAESMATPVIQDFKPVSFLVFYICHLFRPSLRKIPLLERDLGVAPPNVYAHEVSVALFLAAGRMAGRQPDDDWVEIAWMWEEVSGRKGFSEDGLTPAQLGLVLRYYSEVPTE